MKALFGQKGGNISDLTKKRHATKTGTPSCVYFVFPAKSIGVYLLQRIFGEKTLAIKNGEEGILENAMEQIPAPFMAGWKVQRRGKFLSHGENHGREQKKCRTPKQRILLAVKMSDSQAKNPSGNIARTITTSISHLQTSQR
jgi:hypothetical protein